MAFRYDTVRVDKIDRLPNGALRVPGVLTRVGVFEYRDDTGRTVREYRPPEEVFHPDSVQSLRDAPATIGHPRGGVTPTNWAALSVGHVSGVPVRDDATQGLASDVVVARGDAVEKVDRRELADISGGYSVELDPTPGTTPDGQAYDVIQRKIRYNHVALLKRGDGRQGTSVGLRLDSKGDQTCAPEVLCNDGARTMKITLKVDGKDVEVEAGSAEHLAAQTRIDAANDTLIADLRKQIADRDAKIGEYKAREDAAAATAKAAARTALESTARKHLGAEAKFDGKSDRDVMIAVIAKVDPAFDPSGREDAYLAARVDMATPPAAPAAPAAPTFAQYLSNPPAPPAPRADAAPDVESDPLAYATHLATQADNAWRNPAPRN